MSQEIVFTSARKGLRSGSTGFCTVRSTRGMPGNLAQLLERLTGYAHVFDAYSDEASLNPLNFAHYIARLGDQRFHILARISNAPLDHTNRSNKLAHLLAIDSSQLENELSEGPAAESMQLPWVKSWNSETEPYVLPDGKQILLPMANQVRGGECRAWKEATGDAGWAAVLASSATDGKDTMTVIVPRDAGRRAEFWTLQLVNEALSLLPPRDRWDVTYSTFFCGNLPVSINCQWQFVLDGTDLAKRARQNPRSRTIDIPAIAARRTPAEQLPLTALTGSENRPWDNRRNESRTARRRSAAVEEIASGSSDVSNLSDAGEFTEPTVTKEIAQGKTSGIAAAGKGEAEPSDQVFLKVTAPQFSDSRHSRDNLPLLLRPLSLVIYLVMFVLLIVFKREWSGPRDSGTFQEIVKSAKQTNSGDEKSKRRRLADEQTQLDEAARRQREKEEDSRRLAQAAEAPSVIEASIPDAPVADVPNVRQTQDSLRQPPLQDVRDHENRLELKLPQSRLDASADRSIRLARIHVASLEQLQLIRIIGGRTVLKSGLDFSLDQRDSGDQSIRQWDVIRRSISGKGLGGNPDVVGTFQLDEDFNLSFRWDKNNESFELINCLLEMEAGEPGTKPEREKCTLREVKHMPAMVFDQDQAEQGVSLLSRNQLTNTQALELHCNFSNLPGQVSRKGAEILQVGDSVRFHVQGSQQGKYPRTAEIIVKLVETDQDVQIKMETELEMPTEDQRTGKLEVRPVRFSPALMKKATENIKASSDKIDNLRDELKRQQFKHRTVMEELANLDPLDRPPEMKKERDELQATVMRLTSLLRDLDAELKELKSLETDVKQLLNEISSKAQLQFELRLMIPDAVVGGISLVETEDRNQ